MSLNYNIATVANFEDRCYNKLDDGKYELTDATNILIFATMIVDMGTITTENAEKFYTRYRMICAAQGRDSPVGLSLRDRIEREVAEEAKQAEQAEGGAK